MKENLFLYAKNDRAREKYDRTIYINNPVAQLDI